VIFNTAMQGYQEDSDRPVRIEGSIVAMTYPLIGNYGINEEDVESRRPWANGSSSVSAHRSPRTSARASLDEYLERHGIVGLQGIDTPPSRPPPRPRRPGTGSSRRSRAIRRSCSRVPARCRASSDATSSPRSPSPSPTAGARAASAWARYVAPPPPRFRVVAYDCGIKHNILRQLRMAGAHVTVVPAATPAEAVLETKPDGRLPLERAGDPEAVPYLIESVRGLLAACRSSGSVWATRSWGSPAAAAPTSSSSATTARTIL